MTTATRTTNSADARRRGRRVGRALVVAVPLVFIGWFYVHPVLAILRVGFTGGADVSGGGFDASGITKLVQSGRLRGIAWFTLWQAVVSTVLTFIVATPLTILVARYRFRGRQLLRALVTVAFVVPTTVAGAAFTAVLGPRGLIPGGLDRSVTAILLAHVFFNLAVVVRVVGASAERLGPTSSDAAATLGATRWQRGRHVTLPLLAPAIWSAAAIVFLFTFTSLGVVLILGDAGTATLEVEILRRTRDMLDLSTAAVLATVQLVAVAGALVVSARFQERLSVRQRGVSEHRATRPLDRPGRLLLGVSVAIVGVLQGLPLAMLALRSVRGPDGFTLVYLRALATDPRGSTLSVAPLEALANTLVYGVSATLIALVIGSMAAWTIQRRGGGFAAGLDALLMLPLGTSAATLGFGFLVALDAPIDLRTSPILVPIAHALVAVPFVVRTVTPVLRSIDERLREAAATLGASPAQAWREVDLPLVRRALATAATFAFAISAGEFGATIFIARADRPTLPLAIYRLLGRPGDLQVGQAMALSTLLLLLVGGLVLATELRRDGSGETVGL